MVDVKNILERQAAWQKSRRELPWSEKIRQAAILRDELRSFSQAIKVSHPTPSSAGRSHSK